MATYAELEELRGDSALFERVRVATWVAAETVRTEAPATANHIERLVWAKDVFERPDIRAKQMFFAVLAANKAITKTAIEGAADAALQTAVDAAVDLFAV